MLTLDTVPSADKEWTFEKPLLRAETLLPLNKRVETIP